MTITAVAVLVILLMSIDSGQAYAVPPQLDLTPASPQSFGSQQIGKGPTEELTVTMTNNAAVSDDLIFADSSAFDITSDPDCSHFQFVFPSTPLVIAPGASQTFTVAFDPITAGTKGCEIYLYSNDPVSPHTYGLIGTGTQSSIDMTPDSQDWGTVVVGSIANQTVSIANSPSSSAAVTVTTLALSGPDANQFAIVSPATPFTINPNSSQTITLGCTPASAGTKTATIVAIHDADVVTNADTLLSCTGADAVVPVGHWTSIAILVALLTCGQWLAGKSNTALEEHTDGRGTTRGA